MTHTNHRRGSRESLQKDYIVLAMIDPAVEAQHMYKGPLKERVKSLLKILAKHSPVALSARTPERRLRYLKGWGPSMDSGIHQSADLEEVAVCDDIEGIGHAVYDNKESIEAVLRDLKEADLGISIVISGIFDEVFDVCQKVGLKPHTVNI